MQSLWSETTQISERGSLQGDVNVENVVIGAGMAGILTAYFLQKSGKQVIVLEADRIAGGQTKNTTAKLTSQHGLIYYDLLKKAGENRAKGYAMANESAINAYEELIKEEGISCDFERLPSFLYTTQSSGVEKLWQEARAAKMLGLSAGLYEKINIGELPFPVRAVVCFENQAQFHPLKLIQTLAAKLTVYENTNVLSVSMLSESRHQIRYQTLSKDKSENRSQATGTITAQNIIFTTHYPFLNVPGFYFIRQHQERSYALALEGGQAPQKLSGMYYGIDEGGLSFRSADGLLLLGGGSHRTGKKSCHCEHAGYSYLRKQAREYYPNAEEKACWAAQDCMPHDCIPFIGRYSVFRPYWYVATGFQKWGMTTAMVAAQLISDRICGRENPYEKVFSPQRLLVRAGIKNLCVDIGESTVGLTKGLFGGKHERCTHMGCHLEWNEEEQSWDCPCHGSRFDKEKQVIDNPAQPS